MPPHWPSSYCESQEKRLVTLESEFPGVAPYLLLMPQRKQQDSCSQGYHMNRDQRASMEMTRRYPQEWPNTLSAREGDDGPLMTAPISLSEIYRPPPAPLVFAEAERVAEEARAFVLPHLKKLSGNPRLQQPFDETVSMCSQLISHGDSEGVFLATVFFTLQFVNDDLCDGQDVYDLLRATPATQQIAGVLKTVRAQPSLLAIAMASIIQVLREPVHDSFPVELGEFGRQVFLYDAFKEFSCRLHSYGQRTGSPHFASWLVELCESLVRFCRSHALIYQNMNSVSIQEYATHKLTNCGMHHTLLLLELATKSFLSPQQRRMPAISELCHHCCQVGSLLNEVMSYEKEHLHEKSGNLVAVIMDKQGCDLRTAVEQLLKQARHHRDELQRLALQVLTEHRGEDEEHRALQQWVRAMETTAAGCWHWQIAGTSRYQSPTSPFLELRTATRT